MSDYDKLHSISKRTRTLQAVSSLLDWDQDTHMPKAAAPFRAEQFQIMAGLIHKERTSKKFLGALSKLMDVKTGKIIGKGLTNPQKRALKQWRRGYLITIALPKKFVEAFAKLSSQSIETWKEARAKNQFKLFAPYLKKIVKMSQKQAAYLGYKKHPYDALVDLYEPEMTTEIISPLFEKLKEHLIQLVKKISSAKQVDSSFLKGEFSQDKQMQLGKQLLMGMGYDFNKGALDLTTHPFSCSQHPTDSRVTTRIDPTNFMSNVLAVLHEGGHSLYAMGLPVEHFGSPLADAISHGMHESQSRWWETRIGLSKPYWQHYLPLIKETFKGPLEKITLDQYYKGINKVEPTFIRVGADEVTYSLHVILRYELEKALLEGSLKVEDVPAAWNAKMKEYFGITPSKDSDGCLQDIHWSMGGLGYFPSYTLGNMFAAQLFEQFAEDHKDWEKRVSKGDLTFVKKWLNENVHQYGKQFSSKELLEKVTGKPFSADPYVKYLNAKYKEIYIL